MRNYRIHAQPVDDSLRERKILGRIGDFWFAIVRPTPES